MTCIKTKIRYFLLALILIFNWGCEKEPAITFNTVKVNTVTFNRILVLGNSITKHPPLPSAGWYGNWGMAASSQDKDFVHVLEKQYREINSTATVTAVFSTDWETSHQTYNLANLDQYFIEPPNMVILRLGENVTDPKNLDASLEKLIAYIKSKSPNTKFMISGLVWASSVVEDQLESVAASNNFPFIRMNYLNTVQYSSHIGAKVEDVNGKLYEITSSAIANHPGDVGMRAIAALLYNELVTYKF